MRARSKLLFSAIVAAIMLGGAVGTAAANRFEINSSSFRIVWAEAASAMIEPSEVATIRCSFTLEGTLHSRTIAKVSGSLLGYVTRAAVSESACRSAGLLRGFPVERAKLRFLQETLPWHVRYKAFTGALPRITEVQLLVVGQTFNVFELPMGNSCLYRATGTAPTRWNVKLNERGEITGVQEDETIRIPLSSGTNCTADLVYSGIGAYTQLGNTTRVAIRLI